MSSCGSDESMERALLAGRDEYMDGCDGGSEDDCVVEWCCTGEDALFVEARRWSLLGSSFRGCSAARATWIMYRIHKRVERDQISHVRVIRAMYMLLKECDAVRRARLLGCFIAPCSPAFSLLLMQTMAVECIIDVHCAMMQSLFASAWNCLIPTFAKDAQIAKVESLVRSAVGEETVVILRAEAGEWPDRLVVDALKDCMRGGVEDVIRVAALLHMSREAHAESPARWDAAMVAAFRCIDLPAYPFFYVIPMYFERKGSCTSPRWRRFAFSVHARITASARIHSRVKKNKNSPLRELVSLIEPGRGWAKLIENVHQVRCVNPVAPRESVRHLLHIRGGYRQNHLLFQHSMVDTCVDTRWRHVSSASTAMALRDRMLHGNECHVLSVMSRFVNRLKSK